MLAPLSSKVHEDTTDPVDEGDKCAIHKEGTIRVALNDSHQRGPQWTKRP
jgi:hypothetical protein